MKIVGHRTREVDCEHLKLLFCSSLIRSKMDYGAILHDNANKSELQK